MTKKKKLSIGSKEIYDIDFLTDRYLPSPFPIGIKANYPEDLLKNFLASAMAFQLGYKSIDRVKKIYLKDKLEYNSDEINFRSSKKIIHFLDELKEENHKNSIIASASKIEKFFFTDFAFSACLGTMRTVIQLSQQGYIKEPLILNRNNLEILAWCKKLSHLKAEESPLNVMPSSCIGQMKKEICGMVGQYYGYLSKHAHFHFSTHPKHFTSHDEFFSFIQASGTYKLESYLNILIMMAMAIKTYRDIYSSLPDIEFKKSQRIFEKDLPKLFDEWISTHQNFEYDLDNIPLLMDIFESLYSIKTRPGLKGQSPP